MGNVTLVRAPVLAAAFSALVLSFAAAGCGSGSNHTPPGSALTAAEWRREASAICREMGRKVRAVPRPRTDSGTSPFIAAVLPVWRRQADRIDTLVAPSEIAVHAADYLAALRRLEEALVEIHISTQRDDERRRSDAVGKSEQAAEDVRLQASLLEVPACGRQRIP